MLTPIQYVTLHFRDQRGASSLPYRNRAALSPFLCVSRSPIRYDFRAGTKSIRYSVDIALTLAEGLLEMTLVLTYHNEDWLQVSTP